MKQIILMSITILFSLVLFSNKSLAQVVVKEKPIPPKIKMLHPKKPGSDYTFIPGHWLWHRPSKMYVWIGPSWTLIKEDKKWVPGHWKEMPKGWKWTPGHWEKRYKRRYFIK